MQMIIDAFRSFGLPFDEGATTDGETGIYGPYRQSQRAEIYLTFVKVPRCSAAWRTRASVPGRSSPPRTEQQGRKTRKTSATTANYAVWLTVRWRTSRAELAKGAPYVVRFPLGGQH